MSSETSETLSSAYSESLSSISSESSSSTESPRSPARVRPFLGRIRKKFHRQRRGKNHCDRCQREGAQQIPRQSRDSRRPLRMARDILALTNELRRKHNLPKLRLSRTLCYVARKHCEDMASMGKMTHKGSDGRHHSSRMLAAGYRRMHSGENVAVGNYSARVVFDAWLRSESHRSNLMHREFREMGCSLVDAGRSRPWEYWTQLFGVRK